MRRGMVKRIDDVLGIMFKNFATRFVFQMPEYLLPLFREFDPFISPSSV